MRPPPLDPEDACRGEGRAPVFQLISRARRGGRDRAETDRAGSPSRLQRQYDTGAQAASRQVRERELAAMGSDDRHRDRQPQADAAGLPASRSFYAIQGLKNLRQLLLGDAGPRAFLLTRVAGRGGRRSARLDVPPTQRTRRQIRLRPHSTFPTIKGLIGAPRLGAGRVTHRIMPGAGRRTG